MAKCRTPERVRFHYEVEKELADRLRVAEPHERLRLYGPVYDELFRRVCDHPQVLEKADGSSTARAISEQLAFIAPLLRRGETRFLEIGPGDCALSFAVSAVGKSVHAVDVSDVISAAANVPENFTM